MENEVYLIIFGILVLIRVIIGFFLKNYVNVDLLISIIYLLKLLLFLLLIFSNFDLYTTFYDSISILLYLASALVIGLAIFYIIRHYNSWKKKTSGI